MKLLGKRTVQYKLFYGKVPLELPADVDIGFDLLQQLSVSKSNQFQNK